MAWRLWHAAPGPLPSKLHTCWLTWNGGVITIILCVLTHHCAWRWFRHESGAANWRRNATGTVRLRWQLAEPPDDGRRARCSLVPCQRFPLERHSSLMWEECHVARKSMKVSAEALGGSLASGRGGLSGLLNDEHPA